MSLNFLSRFLLPLFFFSLFFLFFAALNNGMNIVFENIFLEWIPQSRMTGSGRMGVLWFLISIVKLLSQRTGPVCNATSHV